MVIDEKKLTLLAKTLWLAVDAAALELSITACPALNRFGKFSRL